jgi:hypothetical protein
MAKSRWRLVTQKAEPILSADLLFGATPRLMHIKPRPRAVDTASHMKRWLRHNWTLVAWYSWIATLAATLGYFLFD